jgi:SAM-dependent methyltransferase
MTATLYTPAFYTAQRPDSELTAEIILGLLFPMLGTPRSVCDVGCGTGCWLKVAKELGAVSVQGFDGQWAGNSLVIPKNRFHECDLNTLVREQYPPNSRFDLALCLETAEHLEPESAGPLVQWLTSSADVVLFSAAVPGQGGTGHVNEQWQDYWVKLFEQRRFGWTDVIRPKIWEDNRIPFWYRQNTLVFTRWNTAPESLENAFSGGIATIVHPELYMRKSGFFY